MFAQVFKDAAGYGYQIIGLTPEQLMVIGNGDRQEGYTYQHDARAAAIEVMVKADPGPKDVVEEVHYHPRDKDKLTNEHGEILRFTDPWA